MKVGFVVHSITEKEEYPKLTGEENLWIKDLPVCLAKGSYG